MADSGKTSRIPPHSIEAERAVLSAILNYREAIHDAAEILAPDCFFDGRHSVVFASAIDLYNEGVPIDDAFGAMWISGTLTVQPAETEFGLAGYTLNADTAEVLEF